MIKSISTGDSPIYADVVVVEDKYLYLSGLTSEDLKTGNAIGGDITTQTRIVLENLKTILEANGSDMDHVIRCEVVLKDFSERPQMNEEYKKHFNAEHIPSRICYGNVVLSGENKIEILATAIKKS